MTDPVNGRLLWFELITTDLPAAEAFYTTAVGWTITPFDGMPMRYPMWTRPDGGSMGGAMVLPDDLKAQGVPAHWMLYVGTTDLDGSAARATELGGSAATPVIDVPNVGKVRVMRDAQGAAFGLYQPAQPPQVAEAEAQVGDVSWIELMTTDAPAAMTFYQALFGWNPTEAMDMGPMGTYQMFGRHLGSLGGMMNKTAEMAHVPPNWGLYFRVPDLDAGGCARNRQRRKGPERPDGGARRRPHRELYGPARGCVLIACPEGRMRLWFGLAGAAPNAGPS